MKITKIKLIPFLIGIVLLGVIPNATAQTNQGFENYTNQNYQFQISFPQDWDISEKQKIDGFDITFTKPISETDCKIMFHINIEDQPPNFDDFIDNHLGSLFTDFSNLKISYSNYSTFVNNESYTVQYSGIPHIAKPGCNNFTFSENYLIENDSGFVFRYMFEDSENSEIENQLQHMMNSITFDVETVVEPVVETVVEPVVETVVEPEIPQTNYNVKIRFSISPSVVEAESKTHHIGYIQTIDSNGLPVSAPADLLIKLSSSDTDIAQVPKVVSLPFKEEITTFDITVNEIEGSSIITAEFQNQVLLQEILVGGEFVSEVLQDVSLKIHMPSSKTLINSKIPFSVFMQSNGTALQAPKDILVTLEYHESLLKIPSDEIIIKKGTYYALSTFETLGNEGNAFLRAKTLQPILDTIENIKVTSTKPAELFITILPEEIAHTENNIDFFIGLLDTEGNPTLAQENISVNIFSDQVEFERSINESIQPKGVIIKKGEFGYHLRHNYIFQTLPNNITITVGVSTAGLKVGTDTFELLEQPLSAGNEKAMEPVIEVFTVEKMPLGAKAIAVYQLRAVETDDDDVNLEIQDEIDAIALEIERVENDITQTEKIITTLTNLLEQLEGSNTDTSDIFADLQIELGQMDALNLLLSHANVRLESNEGRLEVALNDHPIDDLAEGETYPIQTQSNYIQDNSFQSISTISYDEDKITILDSGILSITKSYGTMIIQSGQETGVTEISAVLGGIGTGSATVEVLSSSNPESTKVFSPVGEKNLVFNSQGVIDIILLPMDNDGRPTISENPIEYLLKPTNDFLTVNPRENFAKTEIQSSSFGTDLARGNSTMIVIPIGVDAKTELEAELTFDLVPSSSTITPMFPFDMIAGVNKENNGIVQLVDFFGNPVTVTQDLPVFLESLNSDVIEVPDNITIKAGNSYTTFPITVSTTEGTTNITATAKGFRDGNTNINTKLFSNDLLIYIDSIQQPISFDEDVTVKIFVDDLNAKSIEGVTLTFSGDENLEISPNTAITDNTGLATITIKAIAGPETSLTVQAVKAGFTSDEVTKNLSVSGLAITDDFLGIPSWVMYAMIIGIVGVVGAVLFFFMKKPKEVKEEEEEEEEI